MSSTTIQWGNAPYQNNVNCFLDHLSVLYPPLVPVIQTSREIGPDQTGPDIPILIDGHVMFLRKLLGVWKVYGADLPECKRRALIRTLESAMSTLLS